MPPSVEPIAVSAPEPRALDWRWDIPAPVTWAGPRPIAADGPFTLGRGEGRLAVSRWASSDDISWTAWLGDNVGNTGALTHDGAQVYVAHHSDIASGCGLTALDAVSGEIAWSVQLQGLGPIGHSQYHNDVQLDVDADYVSVYGWEAAGRYTERVDKTTGARIDTIFIDDELAEIPFSTNGLHAVPAPGPIVFGSVRGSFVFTEASEVGEDATLARTDDEVAWTLSLPGNAGCGTATMALIDEHLFVARYCPSSTGARLLVVDPQTGRARVDRPLRALGPIDHSRYVSRVRLGEAHGHAVVWGVEVQGRYVEVVDIETGRTKISRTDRAPYVSR